MKRLILFIGLFFFTQGLAAATVTTDFKFKASILGDPTEPVSVRLILPFTIIKNTSSGFSDVRIFDDTGTEIPYVIYPQRRYKETPRSFSWKIVNYQYLDTVQTVVLKRPKDISIARDLRISTSAKDFIKGVSIYTSNDQKVWDALATGSFFDFSSQVDFRKNHIDIPEIKGMYIRIVFTDTASTATDKQNMRFQYKDLVFSLDGTVKGEIKINGFNSYIGKKKKETYFYDAIDIPTPKTFMDTDKNTIVKLGNLNIPVDQVVLNIKNPYFYRHVEWWVAEKDVDESYRFLRKDVLFRVPDLNEDKTVLPVQFARPAHVRLKIINKDNPPLKIENVHLKWVRRNLYFMPEKGRSYTLYWKGPNIKKPDYELRRMIPNHYDRLMGYRKWAIGDIQENRDYAPKDDAFKIQRVQKYIFVGIIILLVCGLGFWVVKLMGKMSEGKEG